MWFAVEPAPAEQPSIVICFGLPPNAAMFSRTHRSASRWSCSPSVLNAGPVK